MKSVCPHETTTAGCNNVIAKGPKDPQTVRSIAVRHFVHWPFSPCQRNKARGRLVNGLLRNIGVTTKKKKIAKMDGCCQNMKETPQEKESASRERIKKTNRGQSRRKSQNFQQSDRGPARKRICLQRKNKENRGQSRRKSQIFQQGDRGPARKRICQQRKNKESKQAGRADENRKSSNRVTENSHIARKSFGQQRKNEENQAGGRADENRKSSNRVTEAPQEKESASRERIKKQTEGRVDENRKSSNRVTGNTAPSHYSLKRKQQIVKSLSKL
ncbi:hypothetical protein CDAR_218361 [Caerostris darwini]|uniref:Uncharacterized protein n=1 Tax=Caerostris darwini TaxID=1538125 RepID=A0AAV4R9E9_9ARAC|nr:hypothetical protein CDAR_218361 [Caerostris darwini]